MLSSGEKIGIAVPCFNEAERIPLSEFIDITRQYDNIHFCFINDGSTDKTKNVLQDISELLKERVSILHLKKNEGKAKAVQAGVIHLFENENLQFLGYWDADGATPLKDIFKFVEVLEKKPSIEVVMGSRIQRMGANINRRWYRHYFGRIFATAASILLSLPVYDTQCGAKLFRRNVVDVIFRDNFLTKWVFDVELLARMIEHYGVHNTKEMLFELPLEKWEDKNKSRIKFYHCLKAPFELYKILRNYSLSR